MGLLTSFCKKCDSAFTWFGHIPQGLKCSVCGEHMEYIEIVESSHKYQCAYELVMSKYRTHTKEQMREEFADDKYCMHIIEPAY